MKTLIHFDRNLACTQSFSNIFSGIDLFICYLFIVDKETHKKTSIYSHIVKS